MGGYTSALAINANHHAAWLAEKSCGYFLNNAIIKNMNE
jgi:hypothetical protein